MNYATYDDGEPISNTVRSMTSGRVWSRRSDDQWSDGVFSGGWFEVELFDGPFTDEHETN